MRIGIEAQRLFRPHKHGMDKVVLELILNLQKMDQENDYFIFVKPDQDKSVIPNTANFKVVEIPGSSYPSWEQLKLPKVAKEYHCDLLHCTSNTAPYFIKTPLMTTLHDIIYMEGSWLKLLLSKASSYQKFGNLYRRIIVGKVVKNSHRLITVSHFEKDNITRFFKLKNKSIQTIYNGVNENFTTKIEASQWAKVKTAYQLPEDYLLHMANTDPRKNTRGVLLAFNDFLKQTTVSYKLVILGYNEAELKSVLNEMDATHLSAHIILTGYVSDEDLPAIYGLSKLFLFPSLREGFGIPIIEAMACGVPVITSRTSSMPEVAGDAAHLINPHKPEEICEGMLKITSDANYRQELIQKGLIQSKKFSWNNMAKQVLAQYKELYQEIKK